MEINEVAPGRPNAIVTWADDSGERTLMFQAHTDVVTPGNVSAWAYDPFGAQITGRQIYDRGTRDTKGNLAGHAYGHCTPEAAPRETGPSYKLSSIISTSKPEKTPSLK